MTCCFCIWPSGCTLGTLLNKNCTELLLLLLLLCLSSVPFLCIFNVLCRVCLCILTSQLATLVFGQHLNKHIWNWTEFHLGFLQAYLFCGFCANSYHSQRTYPKILRHRISGYSAKFHWNCGRLSTLALRTFLQCVCTSSTKYVD
jgi:hypothetical protein